AAAPAGRSRTRPSTSSSRTATTSSTISAMARRPSPASSSPSTCSPSPSTPSPSSASSPGAPPSPRAAPDTASSSTCAPSPPTSSSTIGRISSTPSPIPRRGRLEQCQDRQTTPQNLKPTQFRIADGTAVSLVTGATQVPDVHSHRDMLGAVESKVTIVLGVGLSIMKDAGVTTFWYLFAGAILAAPFLFVWGIFLAFVVEGIFKLLAVTAVSPLLIAAAAFKPSRGFAVSGFRIVLGGVLTVVFAAVAMGFTLHVMDYFIGEMPVVPGSGFKLESAADWVGGPGYWALIVLGFVSVLFHLKAATLAANISGASDGPGAAATVVAGGLAAVAAAKGAALWSAGKAGRFGGRGLGVIGEAAAKNRDRIWGGAKDATQSGGN